MILQLLRRVGFMKVHIQLLRQSEDLRQKLQNDGWKVEPEKHDSIFARHPLVLDEEAARSRLHHLHLLTSRSLRIEFDRIRAHIYD